MICGARYWNRKRLRGNFSTTLYAVSFTIVERKWHAGHNAVLSTNHRAFQVSSRLIEHRTSYVMWTVTRRCRRQLKYYEITYNEYVWPAIHSTLALSILSLALLPSCALFIVVGRRICIPMQTSIFASRMKHRSRTHASHARFTRADLSLATVLKRRQVYDFQFTGCWTRF